jgi:hypothetical protein
MLTAVEYLGSVGVGVTAPQVFRAEDGKVYVVKLQNNPMGAKVLVNEYIACWFGERLNLCFPPGDVLEIDKQVIRKSRRLRAAGVIPQYHFASQYIHSNKYVGRSNLNRAANKSELAGVILFDHMFHNIDRTKNSKNLIVCAEEGTYRLYAIDNSHLFVRGRWNVETLGKLVSKVNINRRRAYGWLFKYFLAAGDFTSYVDKVRDITEQELSGLVASVPREWLPKEQEREALLGYMIKRCNMVNEILFHLCQSISDVNRRTHFY